MQQMSPEEYRALFGGETIPPEQTFESFRIEPADYLGTLGKVDQFTTKNGFTGKQIDFFLIEKSAPSIGKPEQIIRVAKSEGGVQTLEPLKDRAGHWILNGIIFGFRMFDPNPTATQPQKNFANFQRKEFANAFGALNDNGQVDWEVIKRSVGAVVTFQLTQRPNSKYVDFDVNSFKVIPAIRTDPKNIAALYREIEKQQAQESVGASSTPDDLPF